MKKVDVSYELAWLPLGDLKVDYYADAVDQEAVGAYQRKQEKIQKRIVEEAQKNGGGVNPDLFGALTVNRRKDGVLAVVDGGTRYRALKELGYPSSTLVPAFVHAWGLRDEVDNYLNLNSERMGFSQVDKFIGRRKRGDKDAIAIEKILQERDGVGVKRSGWQCVNVLEAAYEDGVLEDALTFIRRMQWHHGGRNQAILGALRVLFNDPNFDPERAAEKWLGMEAKPIISAAKNKVVDLTGSRSVYKGVLKHLVLGQNAWSYNYRAGKSRVDLGGIVG